MGDIVPFSSGGMKRCGSCHEEKAISSFNRQSKAKDGRQSICHECRVTYDRRRAGRFASPTCDDCGVSVSTFQRRRCETCARQRINTRAREFRAQNPRQLKLQAVTRQYGLSPAEYDMILKSQDNCCAICRAHVSNQKLHVDHDHVNGEVRGLLCVRCNMGLGCFKDEKKNLERAIWYIHREIFRGITQPERPDKQEPSCG